MGLPSTRAVTRKVFPYHPRSSEEAVKRRRLTDGPFLLNEIEELLDEPIPRRQLLVHLQRFGVHGSSGMEAQVLPSRKTWTGTAANQKTT